MKQILRIAISIGISLTILALLLQLVNSGLPDQQRPGVLVALQNTSKILLLAFFGLYLVTLLIRAIRYRLLIVISGEVNVPSLPQMALVTGIRNMLVDSLPARLGELGYIGLLNRGYGVGLQHCLSSLTISVAFDFLALLVIVLLVVIGQFFGSGIEAWALGAMFIAIILSLIAFTGLFFVIPAINRWLKKSLLSNSGAAGVRGRALQLLNAFSQSLKTVWGAGRLGTIFSLSLVIRALKYLSLYCLFMAVAKPNFDEIATLSAAKVLTALIGGELGASLPIPSFMSFGVYEASASLVFQILGVIDQAAAVVTLLCTHIWSQFMEYLMGGVLLLAFVFLRKPTELKRIVSPRQSARYWSIVLLASVVLFAGLSFLAWEIRAARKGGAITPPSSGQALQLGVPQSKSNLPTGFVVFSSNRDGNHDIFRMSLPDMEISKLTDHPHTETYPRISPDGRRILFSRAHQKWVSQRNQVAWDVYMKDIGSGKETRLGINGTSPQWLSNLEITYLKDADKVVKVDIESGGQSIVYQTGVGNDMPVGATIHDPEISPISSQLVFTGLQRDIGMSTGHWGTAISTDGSHKGLYSGCELTWSSDGKSLYQVAAKSAAQEHQIVSIDAESLKVNANINLSGEFNHEYFPEDSNNGEYLVFGASRGPDEHEHDTADYEIFLWKAGTDSSSATRLTFHTGNDNWPDVFIREPG